MSVVLESGLVSGLLVFCRLPALESNWHASAPFLDFIALFPHCRDEPVLKQYKSAVLKYIT